MYNKEKEKNMNDAKTTMQKIHAISYFIRKNGNLVNKAKSAYGADRWELGLLTCTIEDDGYTTRITSNSLGLRVSDWCGNITFHSGTIKDLDTLYDTIFFE
jgi:hypothetical protein